MAVDISTLVTLPALDVELSLTVHFNGGPILISIDDGTSKDYTFSADPFFRRRDHYIAAGSVLFRVPSPFGPDDNRVLVTVQFVNAFPADTQPASGVRYDLQLTSPRTNVVYATYSGAVAPNQFQNVVLLLAR